jgi:glycosyltransferase involved in cell wall biosynthesis
MQKDINKKQTILFVMPRLPFPATSGRKTSLYNYCRIISNDLGYRLVVAAFLEDGDNPAIKPDFIDKLVVLPSPSAKSKAVNIAWRSLLKKDWPMQVALFWSPKAKKIVNRVFREERPVAVIGDMVRSTEYIRDLPTYRIADLDDRISLRYQRQLDTDIDGINPYGAYINAIPFALRRPLLSKLVKTEVVKNEINLLHKYEIKMGQVCDRTIFVASKEANQFNKELKKEKAIAVPIGVDVDFFKPRHGKAKENIIGFLGAMSVAHNEFAASHFIKDILPLVLKKVPDARFMVIGGGVSDELRSFASGHVVFTGRVPDVREYLEKCKVFVCPMTFGSGIKTKNLEAMSMGLPIVTTSIGAENIDVANSKEWFVTDNDMDFADRVTEILHDDNLVEEMGNRAAAYIRENWTWKAAEIKFSEILGETIE